MLKTTLKVLALSVLILSSGCSDDDKGSDDGGNINFPEKPQNCGPTLQVNIEWGEDSGAFQYLVEIGYQKGGAFETHVLDAPKRNFQIIMDRGAHYFYSVHRTSNAGQTKLRHTEVHIPNCENWNEFAKAHPNYKEPVTLSIQW